MRKDSNEDTLFEDSCLSEFKLYEKMLSSLVQVVESSQQPQCEEYQAELHRLLVPLMLRNHFPFLPRIKIKIIRYFINHPLLFVGGEDLTEEKEIAVNGQLMRLLDSLVRSINDKCLTLREKVKEDQVTIREVEELMASEKEKELNGILEQIMISPHSQQLAETKCYLHH
jgi:flagellar motility protein MotE (MotC chaperone)